ncbi:MAG: endolytic transglycosylase MltG [Candidatus Acidiferrum sp.]
MKTLGKLFLLLLIVAVGVVAYFWISIERPYQAFPPQGVFVDLPHGASSRGVARLLEQNGVIRSATVFEIYARRHPKRRLQAGEYFFNRPISGHDVFWQIADGHVFEQPFTVREGETMFDIARDLEAGKYMPANDFLTAAKNPELIHDLAPDAKTLEGYLYPATYNLPRRPAANELTAEMVKKFKEEWARIRSEAQIAPASGLTEHLVTLASLVERETPKADERPLVAGIFENRLSKNMRLQCDPTVIYALEQNNQYKGTLTGADLQTDSPYNTYQHAGLPPGPIGNPGEESLRAAVSPTKTPFLYFVANTQGGHFFSATLQEHNRNVTKYRQLLKNPAGASAPQPTPAPDNGAPDGPITPKPTGAANRGAAQ